MDDAVVISSSNANIRKRSCADLIVPHSSPAKNFKPDDGPGPSSWKSCCISSDLQPLDEASIEELESALNTEPLEAIDEPSPIALLRDRIFFIVDTEETPLIIACKAGDLQKVRYLVEVAKVDINQRGNIQTQRESVLINSTALHAAIIAGHVHVVYYLVHNKQTNVNVKTEKEQSLKRQFGIGPIIPVDDPLEGYTALHLAVLYPSGNQQRDIICCLLAHGADWTITTNAGKQCWEFTTNIDLTILFLHYGVGRDSTHNSTSSNIAHKWARSPDERASEVLAIAITKGVDINELNAKSLTPLMIAAMGEKGRPNISAFEQILNQNFQHISRLNRINALELVGGTLILDDQIELGLEYWRKAMECRFEVEPFIPKPAVSLSNTARIAFGNAHEIQTKEELDNISLVDQTLLPEQALLVYVRILGLNSDETLFSLERYACKLWHDNNQQVFVNYTILLLEICDPTEFHLDLYKNILTLSMFLITRPSLLIFKNAMLILENMVTLLQRTSRENCCATDVLLEFIVNFTYVLLAKPLTSQEILEFKAILSKAVHLGKRDKGGNDLLLLALSPKFWHYHSSYENDISELLDLNFMITFNPLEGLLKKTIDFLSKVGAHPHTKNARDETAIHILAKDWELFPAIKLFYEAGVRLDEVDYSGRTAADNLRFYLSRCLRVNNRKPCLAELIAIPINKIPLHPLKYLCARIVKRFGLHYNVHLPNRLFNYIHIIEPLLIFEAPRNCNIHFQF